ncbi:MAG: PqqD family protein [Acidimicrobiia bacterium]
MAWTELDGEVVAIDLRSSTYFSSNTTGALLFRLLRCGATLGQLVDALVEQFAVDPEKAEADAGAFIDVLDRRGLLEPL